MEDDSSCCQGLVFLRKTSGQTAHNSSRSGVSYSLLSKPGKGHVASASTCAVLKPDLSLLYANTIWHELDLTTCLSCCRWLYPCLVEVLCTCA